MIEPEEQFIKEILNEAFGKEGCKIYSQSLLLQYLDKKTKAIHGNSKTRRSLGNIYALYSILFYYIGRFYQNADKYKEFEGFDFTHLITFCRNLYGGSKLQNHPLNSRVNFEFRNFFPDARKDIIISNNGKYMIHIDYIYVNTIDISKVACSVIDKYIKLLEKKDTELTSILDNISCLSSTDEKKKKIIELLNEDSEARIFEIIAYSILKNHYKNISVYFGYTEEQIKRYRLDLYKTGRTNANDGGIDFVMRPVGRFFQVTEVNNYDKYLLDMDKIIHFPLTFVVKTLKKKSFILNSLENYIIEKSGGMKVIEKRYRDAIEEIITINELIDWINDLIPSDIETLINDIDLYYKLELNLN